MSKVFALIMLFVALVFLGTWTLDVNQNIHFLFTISGFILMMGGAVIMIIEAHRDDKRNMKRNKRKAIPIREAKETLEEHEKHCEFCQAMKEYQEERNKTGDK